MAGKLQASKFRGDACGVGNDEVLFDSNLTFRSAFSYIRACFHFGVISAGCVGAEDCALHQAAGPYRHIRHWRAGEGPSTSSVTTPGLAWLALIGSTACHLLF